MALGRLIDFPLKDMFLFFPTIRMISGLLCFKKKIKLAEGTRNHQYLILKDTIICLKQRWSFFIVDS